MAGKCLKVTVKKSCIGRDKYFARVLKGMGLTKLNQTVELIDNDATRGMIRKVSHMVEVVEGE
ncbi:MAG: 50S ribosomal protein L30 [Deltaproteobacteria bacterium]|nr:50S ribosomal protein L30 [Deltaproteobacteria bacterium]